MKLQSGSDTSRNKEILGNEILCWSVRGSSHSAEGEFNMFPSISCTFISSLKWGPKSIAKLDGCPGRIWPSGSATDVDRWSIQLVQWRRVAVLNLQSLLGGTHMLISTVQMHGAWLKQRMLCTTKFFPICFNIISLHVFLNKKKYSFLIVN